MSLQERIFGIDSSDIAGFSSSEIETQMAKSQIERDNSMIYAIQNGNRAQRTLWILTARSPQNKSRGWQENTKINPYAIKDPQDILSGHHH